MDWLYLGGDLVGVQGGYRWFECHDYGHFASQFPHCRGRERRKQASAAKVDEVADRFQREISLVFALLGTVPNMGTWLVDSGASFHITGARDLFYTFIETGSDLCVELGTGVKHAI
jgi:hypothetical protein